ncbi:deoxyribose-phosphate aldolase [Salsuginibacillus kocurii]|uniref:deoxyribose-phosphate aldolase n=1 Tax=Salsuginibacillus kocurii TaxID=427078 RepID=UPI000376A8BE|nr:deoxyribose-phosphate aldolase [Salsuginibacillus kocurii]
MSAEISQTIDHTLLKPEATKEQVQRLINEAKENSFAAVCVNPSYVALAAEELKGTAVEVCTVIGFPLGATTTEVKQYETKQMVAAGATEIDMVINIGALKSGDDELVKKDIQAVVEASKEGAAITKVIIETALLSDEEKEKACKLSVEAGAEFVKTSTGFAGGGATLEDVKLMREVVGDKAEVKASGGIRDTQTALAMLQAGADRIGASASVSIVENV